MYAKKSYFDDTRAGNVFSQTSTPLGLAIPLYTATAATGGSIPIWNPPNSGVDVDILSVTISTASGTAVYGAIGFMMGYVQSIATASGLSAMAATNPVNCYTARQGGSKVISSNTGTVTVTAGTATPPVYGVTGAGWVRTLFQINGEGAAAGLHGNLVCSLDLNGTYIVAPGTLTYLACTLASVALIATTVVWREVPVL